MSAFDYLNTGICSARVILTNGEQSLEIYVNGAESKMNGVLEMPSDPQKVKSATAYADDQGVFNIYLMDKEGNDVCHYDPENYGKGTFSDDFKHELSADEEIIGVYGYKCNIDMSSIFSLGLIVSEKVDQ